MKKNNSSKQRIQALQEKQEILDRELDKGFAKIDESVCKIDAAQPLKKRKKNKTVA